MRLTTAFLLTLDSQEVFDIVAWHLLDQNERATSCDGACLYRAADGKRCAIGWIMPDDVYRRSLESMGVDNLASAVQDSLRGLDFARFLFRHLPLLGHLQGLHDAHRPHEWPAGLRAIARRFGLNEIVIDRVFDEPDVPEDIPGEVEPPAPDMPERAEIGYVLA